MRQRHVTVGVDGSVASFRALDAAAEEAVRHRADLEVVHCVADLDAAGPVLLASVARVRARHPGLPVLVSPVVGDAAQVLAERSREALLTVVGSRGLGGFAGALLHSVGRRLAASAYGPLLVVRGGGPGRAAGSRPYGVLLGLAGETDADAALFAFEEAELRGAGLRVLHAWTYRRSGPAGTPDAEPVCEEIARQSRAAAELPGRVIAPLAGARPGLPVETGAVRSGPVHALVQATAGADLVVVAAHRRAGHGAYVGPVVEALLHHAHCAVAVVPVPPE